MSNDDPRGPGPHPARLRVGVVGAGRVGSVLAAALGRAGHRVVAASAVSDASLRRIRRNLPGVPVLPPDQVLAGADLVLLTVPDDALPGLVAGLASAGAPMQGRLVAHASGRQPRRWWWRWAASLCSLPKSAGISTTPRSRAPPITWSRWSSRQRTCCGRPGWLTRAGCSGRCCPLPWTTR